MYLRSQLLVGTQSVGSPGLLLVTIHCVGSYEVGLGDGKAAGDKEPVTLDFSKAAPIADSPCRTTLLPL